MMNNQISVDVLITYYNQEDCVDKSLETVFSQNADFPVKVIIGDDGSSDNTVLKIKELRQGNCDENSLENRGILLEIFVLLLYNVFEY